LTCIRQRHVVDVVEEDRALVGQLEAALLLRRASVKAPRSCRRARPRAGLGQAAQESATKGPPARPEAWCSARAIALLARAALALDQHGRVGRRDGAHCARTRAASRRSPRRPRRRRLRQLRASQLAVLVLERAQACKVSTMLTIDSLRNGFWT
jgi:hypothetical protein